MQKLLVTLSFLCSISAVMSMRNVELYRGVECLRYETTIERMSDFKDFAQLRFGYGEAYFATVLDCSGQIPDKEIKEVNLHESTVLILDNNKLESLDLAIFSNSSIRHIFVRRNNLKNVTNSVANSVDFESVSFHSNQLSELDVSILGVSLTRLSLSKNKFQDEGSLNSGNGENFRQDFFRYLIMSDNNLTSASFISNFTYLSDIHLENNRIKIVPRMNTSTFRLYLRSNKIRNIGENAFTGDSDLMHDSDPYTYIDLSQNRIETIHPNAFKDIGYKTWIILSGNTLTTVHPAWFEHAYTLELEGNYIDCLSDGVANFVDWLTTTDHRILNSVHGSCYHPLGLHGKLLQDLSPGYAENISRLQFNPELHCVETVNECINMSTTVIWTSITTILMTFLIYCIILRHKGNRYNHSNLNLNYDGDSDQLDMRY